MKKPTSDIPPWKDSRHMVPALALLAIATFAGSVEYPSSPPKKEAVRIADPADPKISGTTSRAHGRITAIQDEMPGAAALETAPTAPPSPEEETRLAREASEQRIREQAAELHSRMKRKYGDLEDSETHVTSITTPSGKKLAVSIQLQGDLVNVYAGPKRYYVGHGPGILQLSFGGYSLSGAFLEAKFAGIGSTYGGSDDLAEVFSAFGFFDPGMPAYEKAEVVLATLLEQL